MFDDTTRGLETPARDGGSIVDRRHCPDCGRALADHGIASAGPGRTRLAPCGLDVSGVTLREVARMLASRDETSEQQVVTDGGRDEEFRCFGRCGKRFGSLDDMVAVAGKGYRDPRHFCEDCAERVRHGPPLVTDGGDDPLAEYDTDEVVAAVAAIEDAGEEPTVGAVRAVIEEADGRVSDAVDEAVVGGESA
jgi:hypothetical protein